MRYNVNSVFFCCRIVWMKTNIALQLFFLFRKLLILQRKQFKNLNNFCITISDICCCIMGFFHSRFTDVKSSDIVQWACLYDIESFIRLSHPAYMEIVLRKRMCLNIYTNFSITSLTDRLKKKIAGQVRVFLVEPQFITTCVNVMVLNATFNNISVLLVEKNWSTQIKPPTFLKSLTNFIT